MKKEEEKKEEDSVNAEKEQSKADVKKQKLKDILKKAKEEPINLDERKEKIIYWIIGAVFLILIIILILSIPKPYKQVMTENNTVVEIVNGNTFKYYDAGLNKDITVRLLCVDISGKNNKTSEEAKNYLRSLISYKEVTLKSSGQDKDFYGKLLRYVYVSDYGDILFVNKLMVDNGYGKLKTSSSQDCKEMK
jgi:endonuclease YncB( thermonuclease family)